MMKPENAPWLSEWATASSVASALGISRQTANQLIRSGEFDTLHLLGEEGAEKPMYVVKRAELEKMKESRTFPRSKG